VCLPHRASDAEGVSQFSGEDLWGGDVVTLSSAVRGDFLRSDEPGLSEQAGRKLTKYSHFTAAKDSFLGTERAYGFWTLRTIRMPWFRSFR
jgi:hypothetical protein